MHAHDAVQHKPAPVVQPSSGAIDPLAAVLALTGRQSASPSVAPPQTPGKSGVRHGKGQHRGQASTRVGGPQGVNGNGSTASSYGQHNAAAKRHHGKAHHATTANPNPNPTSSPGRCRANNGRGVGNGGGTTANTRSHNVQPSATPAPGLRRCR
jgi:hypothetical protein